MGLGMRVRISWPRKLSLILRVFDNVSRNAMGHPFREES